MIPRLTMSLRAVTTAVLMLALTTAPVAATNNQNKWQQKPYGVYLHYIGFDFLSSVPTGDFRTRILAGRSTWNAEGRELYFAHVSDTSPHDYMDVAYVDAWWPNNGYYAWAEPVSNFGEIFTAKITFNATPDWSGCPGGYLKWYTGTLAEGSALPPCTGDVRSIAVHEFGHVVMLSHSPTSNDIMYSTLPVSTAKHSLRTHDREMIRWMYPAK